MIKYAGAPQLGDYVIINDKPENIRVVTTIVMNVDTAVKYWLDNNSIIGFEQDDLTRVKPSWNIGELVRYKGKVYKVQNVTVRNYKFMYSLDDKDDWVAESELEYVDEIKFSISTDTYIRVNKYCVYENLRGKEGQINIVGTSLAEVCLGQYLNSCCLPWEAIDVEEKKVEPYNAELICIHASEEWGVGEIVEIDNGTLYYRSNGKIHRYPYDKFNNLDDVNKSFATARFAEIKETIGDKEGWNGKFYVIDTTADSSLKVGNVYVVKEGIVNIGGYYFTQIFTSFEEIQKRFNHATLIEIK